MGSRFYLGLVSRPDTPAGAEWLVKPSGTKEPYSWSTREEAEAMARRFYPDQYSKGLVRVVEGPPQD